MIEDVVGEGKPFKLLMQQLNEDDDTWYAVGSGELNGIKSEERETNANIISSYIFEFAKGRWKKPIIILELNNENKLEPKIKWDLEKRTHGNSD